MSKSVYYPVDTVDADGNGGVYIINVPETYNGLLIEFQYRELK